MSDKVETAQLAVRPYRSVASQRPARPARARGDRRIIESLNRGVSVAKIAEREDVGEKRMRDPAGQTALSDEAPPVRREMVWARKPWTHNIWYTGARLTVRNSG